MEAGRGIALVTTILKLMSGKRLLYRPLTDTTETQSVGIARATKGDVTPAGEKFCGLLRQMSSEAGRDSNVRSAHMPRHRYFKIETRLQAAPQDS